MTDLEIRGDALELLDAQREAELAPDLIFASGLSRPGNARPFVRVGAPIGITATEAVSMRDVARHYAGAGGLVFVDSGEYSAFTHGETLDFDKVLDVYEEIATGCAQPWNLHVVAPDLIGDQEGTLELLRRYRGRLERLHYELGVTILVGFQKGARMGAELYGAVDEALDYRVPFVPAIAFKQRAWTAEEVLHFVEETEIEHFHLLGAGYDRLLELAPRIKAISPATFVQGDSVRARAWVGRAPYRAVAKAMPAELERLRALAALLGLPAGEAELERTAKARILERLARAELGQPELEAVFAAA